jgi:hypothetical protein
MEKPCDSGAFFIEKAQESQEAVNQKQGTSIIFTVKSILPVSRHQTG